MLTYVCSSSPGLTFQLDVPFGTRFSYGPAATVNGIYGGIEGATSDGPTWSFPCDTVLNVSLVLRFVFKVQSEPFLHLTCIP